MGQRNTPDLSRADHDQPTHAMVRRRTIAINSYASSKFPQEIIEEIMSYLPPKSLIRFKCVSKSWYTLINTLMKNPEFMAKHLRYSSSNNKIFSPSAGLIFRNTKIPCQARKLDKDDRHREPMFYLLSIFNDYHRDRDHDLRFLAENMNLQELIIEAKEKIYYVATHHCNGIICLTYFDTYILYNPAIKEFKLLSKPQFDNKYDRLHQRFSGFGYDSRANDYKVVESRAFYGWPNNIYVANVYTLSTDSWKMIKNPIKIEYSPIPHKEIYFEGVCYWLMEDLRSYDEEPNDIIVSFDMCDDEFRTIPLPQTLQTPKVNCTSFAVWNESVALFFYPGERGASVQSIEICVLVNDCLDGVESSCVFVKQLTIGPLVNISCPLAFWKSDELLLKSTEKGELVSYNLGTKK